MNMPSEQDTISDTIQDSVSDTVPCPACQGTGEREIETTFTVYDHDDRKGKWQARTIKKRVVCLACRETPGRVEAIRVCEYCGKFRGICMCSGPKQMEVRVKAKIPGAKHSRRRHPYREEADRETS